MQALHIILVTLCFTLGPVSHWAFASQYMQTCFLIPGINKKARLLLARHLTVIESEYERTTGISDFVKQHDEID